MCLGPYSSLGTKCKKRTKMVPCCQAFTNQTRASRIKIEHKPKENRVVHLQAIYRMQGWKQENGRWGKTNYKDRSRKGRKLSEMLQGNAQQPKTHVVWRYVCACTFFPSILFSAIKRKEKKGKEERVINTDYYHWGGHFLCSCIKGTPQTVCECGCVC